MNLDHTNQVIFEHLLNDARIPVKTLSKIVKVTPAAIVKRLQYLEKNDYITRYDALINWQSIPLVKSVYFVRAHDSRAFEKKMYEESCVFSLISLFDLYNYQVWCFFKDEEHKKQFESKLDSHEFQEVQINNLVFPKVSFFDVPIQKSTRRIKPILNLSKTDVLILKHIAQGHARDSLLKISKSINIPYDTVHYRTKPLLSSQYIGALVAQPGQNKWSLSVTCVVLQCKNKSTTAKLFSHISKISNIQSLAECKNNTLLVHFLSSSREKSNTIQQKILQVISQEKIIDYQLKNWNKIILNNRYPLEYIVE